MTKTPPRPPATPKPKKPAHPQFVANKAQQAAFKRADKGVSKPMRVKY